jgi:hypothetical protein
MGDSRLGSRRHCRKPARRADRMNLSLGFDARAARSVPYCRTGVVGSARSFPASEQSRSRKASVTGLVERGTPALYEPHFDQFGSGADVVRPAGEQFDVAVVAAASESGDSGIFQPPIEVYCYSVVEHVQFVGAQLAPLDACRRWGESLVES